MDDPLLTYAQAARHLGVPLSWLRSWVRRRAVPHLRLGERCVRFRRTDLDAHFKRVEVPARTPRGSGGAR